MREPENFACHTPDPVAGDCVPDAARGDRQAQSRKSMHISARRDLKQLLTESLPALVNMLKLRRSAEALAGAEVEGSDRISAAVLTE